MLNYRFSINGQSVNPYYKDDLSKIYALESQQRFYRAELNGTLKFLGVDYDFIMSQNFEDELITLIEKSVDGGVTWSTEFTGSFYRTDCKINADDRIIEVSLDTVDQYNKVLAGLEREYNLIKLAPSRVLIDIKKRPLIQAYVPGASSIGCFLAGTSWEQDVTSEVSDTNELINTYKFALASTLHRVTVTGDATPAKVLGEYVSENLTAWYGRHIQEDDSDTQYVFKYESVTRHVMYSDHDKDDSDLGSIWRDANGHDWKLVGKSSEYVDVVQYDHSYALPSPTSDLTHVKGAVHASTITYETIETTLSTGLYLLRRISDNAIFFASRLKYDSVSDYEIPLVPDLGSGTLTATKSTIEVYMRYILDVDSLNGNSTYDIPVDDIVANNRNYQKVIGYPIDCATIYNTTSNVATEFGLTDEVDIYFAMPTLPTGRYYPLARSSWGGSTSIWFQFDSLSSSLDVAGRKQYTLKDGILISDAIKALLADIDASISHEGTEEYSEFLYTDTLNPITDYYFRLAITQKSNILEGEYDKPAQKAQITLAAIFSMLKNCMQAYWYIDSNNKLKIEHVSWFKNGGSYSVTPSISIDLTTLTQKRNGKKWGYLSNKYSFDKESLPDRYEFSWMDDSTEGFDGYPIKINSGYVQKGKIENISVSMFTSDIDYMLLNPEAISRDGFALFYCVKSPIDVSTSELTDTYVINSTTGEAQEPSSISAATLDYIDCKEADYIIVTMIRNTTSNDAGIAFYDSEKTYISGYARPVGSIASVAMTYEVPAGAYYFRTTFFNAEYRDLYGYFDCQVYYANRFKPPFVTEVIEGASVSLQNGAMGWMYLHANFWLYDLPAYNVNINDSDYSTLVEDIQKRKKQKVSFPAISDINPISLIKTGLGNGQVEKMTINLSSRICDVDLAYKTE